MNDASSVDPAGAIGVVGVVLTILYYLLIALSPIWLIIVGGLVGASQERRHFEDIARRESETAGIALSDLKTPPPGMMVAQAALVDGSVVIAADHFKSWCAKWRKLFGGEFRGLQRMQERARREAILRMVEKARAMGATAVCNIRVETSTIAGKRQGKVAGAEMIAFGTALISAP